jgi:hypothetical protein
MVLLSIFALVPAVSFAQSNAGPPLEGVWKITQILTRGANPVTIANPQPGLLIFAHGHYSWVSVNGDKPRTASPAAKDPANMTDAEKLARFAEWSPFTANSGTYATKGATLTRNILVAKNVSVMSASTPVVQQFTVEGDTLWLITTAPAGQPANETRTKFTRVR